jgi:hypothetical protein
VCNRVRQGNVLGYLAEGDYFGEASLASRRNSRYDRNVTAVVDSDLCYLRKNDVAELAREFPKLKQQIISFAKLRKSLEEPRRKFNALDEDSSGSLDHDELKHLLRDLRVGQVGDGKSSAAQQDQVEERDIEEAINEMDWSGDGEVSFEEFEAWWIRRQERSSGGGDDIHGYARREEGQDGMEHDGHGPLEHEGGDGVDGTGDRAEGVEDQLQEEQEGEVGLDDIEEFEDLERKIAARIRTSTRPIEEKVDRLEEKVDRLIELLQAR